jgi:hypothetical protein
MLARILRSSEDGLGGGSVVRGERELVELVGVQQAYGFGQDGCESEDLVS